MTAAETPAQPDGWRCPSRSKPDGLWGCTQPPRHPGTKHTNGIVTWYDEPGVAQGIVSVVSAATAAPLSVASLNDAFAKIEAQPDAASAPDGNAGGADAATGDRLIVGRDDIVVRDDAGRWWRIDDEPATAVRQLVAEAIRERDEARAKTDGGEWQWGFTNATTGEFVHHGDEGQARALGHVVKRPLLRRWVTYGPIEPVTDDGGAG